MMKQKSITAEEFDKIFDEDKESILPYLDMASARRGNQAPKRINLDIQPWMITSVDREASRIGVARQALIKMWIAEKIKEIEKAA